MTDTRTAIRRARELIGDGQPDGACELLRDVLDKEPDNFFHVGLILPNARVIGAG